MGAISLKVHALVVDEATNYRGMVETLCGKVGWYAQSTDEFETVSGGRFEATNDQRRVTCKSCLRSEGLT